MGIFGRFIDSLLYYLFGSVRYLIPLLLITVSIMSYVHRKSNRDFTIILSATLLLFTIAIFFDLRSANPGIFKNRFVFGVNNLLMGVNGGLIGAFLNSFLYKFLGKVGSTIFTVFFTLFFIILLFDLDYKQIGINTFEVLKDLKIFLVEKFSNIKQDIEAKSLKDDTEKLSTEKSIQIDTANSFSEPIIIDSSRKELDKKDLNQDKKNKKNPNTAANSSDSIIIPKSDDFKGLEAHYEFPNINFLNKNNEVYKHDKDAILKNSRIIEETMRNFNIDAKVTKVNTGPTVTCYELIPEPGVRLNKIVSLQDNLAFSLATQDIRILAPIPGKTAVGIEIPNSKKSPVFLREIIDSEQFKNLPYDIPLPLGKNVTGELLISAIEEMPHLLIAGATGSGKSVCINTIILSILYKSSPKDVKMILIDPKVVELSNYNEIPHLLIPVVTNPKKAASALAWAVDEMERRYKIFAKNSVRDIKSYNAVESPDAEKLPKIVIIIDELSDLMMVASNEVEDYITRLAQMARAAGMHLIIATQRPSVDVITGVIKANIPSRISFSVSSQIDSRTILDMSGAEKLLGKGDMLYYPSSYSKPMRAQGAFVSDKEVDKVVNFVKSKTEHDYSDDIVKAIEYTEKIEVDDSEPLMEEAIKIILTDEQASISYLQRKLRIGYSRAARIIDSMEEMGIIGPYEGSKPRKVLISYQEYLNMAENNEQ
ncbi:MAG: DNA translocase FtsK 4TM domain-containing protein [Tissierellia bacterium]|nr:DNA translocase FtsK 4TM domain-containing protein [Tissierellia bacterium]